MNCSLLLVATVVVMVVVVATGCRRKLFIWLIDNWFVQQEDDSDCGGGTSLSPCLWPMLGLQLLLLWLVTSLQHSWPQHTHTHTHTLTHWSSSHPTRGQKTLQLFHPGCMQSICKTRHFLFLTTVSTFSIFQCQRVRIHFLHVMFKNRHIYCAQLHSFPRYTP